MDQPGGEVNIPPHHLSVFSQGDGLLGPRHRCVESKVWAGVVRAVRESDDGRRIYCSGCKRAGGSHPGGRLGIGRCDRQADQIPTRR